MCARMLNAVFGLSHVPHNRQFGCCCRRCCSWCLLLLFLLLLLLLLQRQPRPERNGFGFSFGFALNIFRCLCCTSDKRLYTFSCMKLCGYTLKPYSMRMERKISSLNAWFVRSPARWYCFCCWLFYSTQAYTKIRLPLAAKTKLTFGSFGVNTYKHTHTLCVSLSNFLLLFSANA